VCIVGVFRRSAMFRREWIIGCDQINGNRTLFGRQHDVRVSFTINFGRDNEMEIKEQSENSCEKIVDRHARKHRNSG